MEYIIFDIETRPASDEMLLLQWHDDDEGPKPPGEFDPSKVKMGQCKTDEARARKILEAQAKHNKLVEQFASEVEDARDARIRSLRSKGTLHAESGEIVTIGRKYNGDYRIPDGPEHEQLEEFWRAFTHHRNHGNILIGFNCHEFDMPWIVRRSLVHGVKIPAAVIDKDRYWHSCIVDLMKKWGMGCYGGIHKPSLHRLSLSMGGEGKSQDGRLLYELWDTSRDEAIAYVKHDLDLTEFCARRFGII